MATVNETMTALADEIRELSGTTGKKGLDAMTVDVNDANAEISEQMGLIAQINAALEGKAGGGGASECPYNVVINSNMEGTIDYWYYYIAEHNFLVVFAGSYLSLAPDWHVDIALPGLMTGYDDNGNIILCAPLNSDIVITLTYDTSFNPYA